LRPGEISKSTVDVQDLQIAARRLLFFNTLFTHAFFLIAKNDFLFGDSFPLWERNGVKQKQRDGV
jgi:hypothetical protein